METSCVGETRAMLAHGENLTVTELAARCRSETDRPATQRDERFCLELLRRALAAGDAQAWAAVYAQYHALVRHWLGRVNDAEDLVQETFARFRQAFSAERLASGRFPTLASLLAFLRTVAINQRINQARRIEHERKALEKLGQEGAAVWEADGLDRAQHHELADYIHGLIPDEREWLMLRLSYEFDLTPREIAHSYPYHFADATEVGRIKERVIKRLRNDLRLRAYLER